MLTEASGRIPRDGHQAAQLHLAPEKPGEG
jgi:hypothetical protein